MKPKSARSRYYELLLPALVLIAVLCPAPMSAQQPTAPIVPGSVKARDLPTAGSPPYFAAHYRQFMRSALPAKVRAQSGFLATIPRFEADADAQGEIGSYQPAGATQTAGNAFFQSLGTNGRACITCHQPAGGMSISLKNINERFRKDPQDPLFAPVDGSTCPKNVPSAQTQGSPVEGHAGHAPETRLDTHRHTPQRAASKSSRGSQD
jgi:mono/diheme cytochrome c family protein